MRTPTPSRTLLIALLALLPACQPEIALAPPLPYRAGTGSPEVEAQRIRDEAGIPSGATVGVRPGAAPGLSKRAEREPSEAIRITSREDAELHARAGIGTALDPYRIEHLSILANVSAKAGDYGFEWQDQQADYHIQLHDVEIAGFGVAQVRIYTSTGFTLSHASLSGPGGGLRVGQGKVSVYQTEFSGLGGDGVRTIGSARSLVELIDCAWTETRGPWEDSVVGVQSRSSNPLTSIAISFCDFTAPGLLTGVRAWNDNRFTIADSRFECRNGFEAISDPIHGTSIQRCRFDVSEAPIFAKGLEGGWDFGYCEFNDSADSLRLVRLDDSSNGRVHHSRFTKTTGGEEAGNECLETFWCADVVFDSNWVTECVEDAYEHVWPSGLCTVFDCVGDNVAGQVVDFFGYAPGNAGDIHHIYGDCRDVGVIITDVDNVTVREIHTNNVLGTYYNIRLENRHAEPGVHPANCTILPDLPPASDCYLGFIFGAVGPVGPGNRAEWWENGVLQSWSSPLPTP